MSDTTTPAIGAGLSVDEREALDRVLARIARNAHGIEQALETLEHLTESGALAGLNALLEDWDENFSAVTRPELMGMVANLMMVMGLLSQLSYEPFFQVAMNMPDALNDAYPRFRERTEPLKVRDAWALMRSPEMAGALQAMAAVLASQRGDGGSRRG